MQGLGISTHKRQTCSDPVPTYPAPLLLPQLAPFSILEIPFDLGNKITVSTDDFEGTCEPPDTLPGDSSPLYGSGSSGPQTGRDRLPLHGVWEARAGEAPSGESVFSGDCGPPCRAPRGGGGKSWEGHQESWVLAPALANPAG